MLNENGTWEDKRKLPRTSDKAKNSQDKDVDDLVTCTLIKNDHEEEK